MGMKEATIYRLSRSATARPAQKAAGERGRPRREFLISTLPVQVQKRIAEFRSQKSEVRSQTGEEIRGQKSEVSQDAPPLTSDLRPLTSAVLRFPPEERDAWISELNRLSKLVQRYLKLSPKRIATNVTYTGDGDKRFEYDYAPAVLEICKEYACADPIILKREPRRAQPISPITLDGLSRKFRKQGAAAFLTSQRSDRGRPSAKISADLVEWVNDKWRNYRGPTALHEAAKQKAKKEKWVIPSLTWFKERWKALPEIVITHHMKGEKAYQSKYAPYNPRTASDLGALQLLCGDHRQCDVGMLWRDNKTLIRPWVTLWQCIRTGLIWGWHLARTPSSLTIGRAYAGGVMQFGAQPPSRDGYSSYVYTDNGRDYRSKNFDGTIAAVHKLAARLDGRVEMVRAEQKVGLYRDVDVKQMFARGYNAKEKPVERTNRDLADWESNTFEGWCGRDAKNKPDRWREMWAQHQKFLSNNRHDSPFMTFDEYLEQLAGWIREYNASPHTRSVLDNATIVPIQEFEHMYTTRYDVALESLTLLLMKWERRVIGKDGVGLADGYKSWRYLHPAMSEYKGKTVEVRYDENDLSMVWVVLPNGEICEAGLLEKSSYLTPNKQTASLIKQVAARERALIREHDILNVSVMRGITLEERVADDLEIEDEVEVAEAVNFGSQSSVTKLNRLDRPKLRAVKRSRAITVEEISNVQADDSIFTGEAPSAKSKVRWYDED